LKQSYYITVDDKLPSIENTNGERIPLFVRSPDDLQFWFCYIEKAYAKLHNNYHILNYRNLRESLIDLTCIEPQIFQFNDSDSIKIAKLLHVLKENNSIIGCFNSRD